MDDKKALRRFIINPLLRAIDMGESIDSLVEMRHVVITFANFIVYGTKSSDILSITDRIYKKLNR